MLLDFKEKKIFLDRAAVLQSPHSGTTGINLCSFLAGGGHIFLIDDG